MSNFYNPEYLQERLAAVCKERDELRQMLDAAIKGQETLQEELNKLVRCQNCKHSDLVMETDDGCKHIVCKRHNWWVNSGYFCASGEKNGW